MLLVRMQREKLYLAKLQMNQVEIFLNLATLVIDQEQSEIGIDIRIPVLADKEALVARLREVQLVISWNMKSLIIWLLYMFLLDSP